MPFTPEPLYTGLKSTDMPFANIITMSEGGVSDYPGYAHLSFAEEHRNALGEIKVGQEVRLMDIDNLGSPHIPAREHYGDIYHKIVQVINSDAGALLVAIDIEEEGTTSPLNGNARFRQSAFNVSGFQITTWDEVDEKTHLLKNSFSSIGNTWNNPDAKKWDYDYNNIMKVES